VSDNTALGDRMKGYEAVTRSVLPRRTYTVIRVDGRAFHSYLRHADKPFDRKFTDDMDKVMTALCKEVSGTVFGYSQSDEVSLLLADFGSVDTEPWFGGNVQKMVSVSAAVATLAMGAQFDSRVFTIPSQVEVANYFIWRQRDAVRNSVSMAAQAHFSHKSLHGLNGNQMQEKLFTEKDINWDDYPERVKRGSICVKEAELAVVSYTDKRSGEEQETTAIRTSWVAQDAPHFTADEFSFLPGMIPCMPSFG
jgi:tRNA(His) guanylyltransferase